MTALPLAPQVRAAVLTAQGRAADALNTYSEALGRARKLSLPPAVLGTLLYELACLQWNLGLQVRCFVFF